MLVQVTRRADEWSGLLSDRGRVRVFETDSDVTLQKPDIWFVASWDPAWDRPGP